AHGAAADPAHGHARRGGEPCALPCLRREFLLHRRTIRDRRWASRGAVPGGTLVIEIKPGNAEYDDARAVFNGMIDRRPQVIMRCERADDVVTVVNYARDAGLPLSVYGGGHSVTGAAVVDGGVVCDMRGLKAIDVDPSARMVRAEAGLNWGEFDAATQEHGLAVTGGRVPATGIAGLALGSGSGWLER